MGGPSNNEYDRRLRGLFTGLDPEEFARQRHNRPVERTPATLPLSVDFRSSDWHNQVDDGIAKIEAKLKELDSIRATLIVNFNAERAAQYGVNPIPEECALSTYQLFYQYLNQLATYARLYHALPAQPMTETNDNDGKRTEG